MTGESQTTKDRDYEGRIAHALAVEYAIEIGGRDTEPWDELPERWRAMWRYVAEDAGPDDAYRAWLDVLNEDVTQGEFGYEESEFTALPSLWHPIGRVPMAKSCA